MRKNTPIVIFRLHVIVNFQFHDNIIMVIFIPFIKQITQGHTCLQTFRSVSAVQSLDEADSLMYAIIFIPASVRTQATKPFTFSRFTSLFPIRLAFPHGDGQPSQNYALGDQLSMQLAPAIAKLLSRVASTESEKEMSVTER
jgi:hypothetical protein